MRNYLCSLFICLTLFSVAIMGDQSTVIEPIIVTAAKQPRYSVTSAAKLILTDKQMRVAGITSFAQALKVLGGIQLQDITGTGSQVAINMRGFGTNASSNTLLLVNGIPLTNPDLAPPNLNVIPLQDIETIEIIAGSESVLYGDQAVGGIINVMTSTGSKDTLLFSCTLGSFNQRQCYVNLSHHFKRLKYSIIASTEHSDNYRKQNKYDQTFLQGRLSYPYQTGTLNFDYQIAQETMQYPGALTAAQVRKNRRQAINKSDYFSDWNSSFHFQQQHTLTPDWHFAMDIAERSMEGHGILTSAFQQSRLTQFLKPQVKGIWHSVNLTSGIDYQADRYQLKSLFGITEDRQQKYGVFGIASMPANTLTTLSAGMRAAQQNSHLRSFSLNNTINHALVTTLGSTFQVQPRSLLYLRRAGSFRFPKADENAFTLPGVNSLRTQHGAAYETGIETTDDTYTAKLNLYQLNLRDEITFDPTQTAQAPFGTNRNLPPTIRRGLSLSGSVQATNKLTLGGQYNTVNARFQSGVNRGKHIPLVAENIFRTNLDYTLAENLHFYTEAIYTGSQFAANDDANVGGKIGGYSIVNLNLGYYFKQLNASLRLNNIFNKFYYFYTVHQESMNSEFFYPAPGRNFTLTITYTFL